MLPGGSSGTVAAGLGCGGWRRRLPARPAENLVRPARGGPEGGLELGAVVLLEGDQLGTRGLVGEAGRVVSPERRRGEGAPG
jgi:hypothetical protein